MANPKITNQPSHIPNLTIAEAGSTAHTSQVGVWILSSHEQASSPQVRQIEKQLNEAYRQFLHQRQITTHPAKYPATTGAGYTDDIQVHGDALTPGMETLPLKVSDHPRSEDGQSTNPGFIFRLRAPSFENTASAITRKIPPLMITEHNGQCQFIELINSLTADQLTRTGFCAEKNRQYLERKTKNKQDRFYLGKTTLNTIKFGLMLNAKGQELVAVKKSPSWLQDPTELSNLTEFRTAQMNELAMQQKAGQYAPEPYGIVFDKKAEHAIPKAYIAMELIPCGSLFQQLMLERIDQLSFRELVLLALKIIETGYELQQRGIYHGDIKPGNIIIEWVQDNAAADMLNIRRVVFIDYEHSCSLDQPLQSIDFTYDTITVYHAPEIYESCLVRDRFQGIKTIDDPGKAEVYSLGVTLCQLLGAFNRGETIYLWYDNYSRLIQPETDLSLCFPDLIKQKITQSNIPDPELRQLICQMLSYNPKKRPGLEEVITRLKQFWKNT